MPNLSYPGAETRRRRGLTGSIVMTARAQLIDRLAAEIGKFGGLGPLRVGVDGPDAAGKTTLEQELDGTLIAAGRSVLGTSLDGFHHPRSTRRRRGSLSAEGYYEDAFDYRAFRHCVLDRLGPGGDHQLRPALHDAETDQVVNPPSLDVAPGTMLLVDGVFLQRPEHVGAWDLVIYVHISPAETLRRALQHDAMRFGSAEEVRERYEHRYLPAQAHYRAVANRAAGRGPSSTTKIPRAPHCG